MESQAQGNILSVGTNLLIFTETLKFFPKDGDANCRTKSKKWGYNGTTSRPISFWTWNSWNCMVLYSLQPYAVKNLRKKK